MKILVVGCGVVGLCTAIRLLEAGHDVTIRAERIPPHTTSNIAAAIWLPYKAEPELKVKGWARATLRELIRLAEIPESGVRLVPGKKLFRRPMGDPWWAEDVVDFRRLRKDELGAQHVCGYSFTVPVADTSIYVSHYLPDRFRAGGGAIEIRRVEKLEPDEFSTVVACTGLGSRELASDPQVYPIRGQLVRIEGLSLREFRLESDHPAGMIYIIPRGRDAILGGVADDHQDDPIPDPQIARDILQRCTQVQAEIGGARVLEHLVGLRPGRASVRLEREGGIVYNYGHGGSGITLAWGCADEVARLLSPFADA